MSILGLVLLIIGIILSMIGWLLVLIQAWQDGFWWGVLSFFIPVVGLIYGFMNLTLCRNGMIIWLIGITLATLGIEMRMMPLVG
jgi:hypothetical protein